MWNEPVDIKGQTEHINHKMAPRHDFKETEYQLMLIGLEAERSECRLSKIKKVLFLQVFVVSVLLAAVAAEARSLSTTSAETVSAQPMQADAKAIAGTGDRKKKIYRGKDVGEAFDAVRSGAIPDAIVIFQGGDEIPVQLEAQGDFIESKPGPASTVRVKRDFWIKISQTDVELSTDGLNYSNLQSVVAGKLSLGAIFAPSSPTDPLGGSRVATGIKIDLLANLK
jgi:hypothetical protein